MRVKLGSPVLFTQPRPGKDGKIFNEAVKGEKTRKQFYNEILDVLALLGGDVRDVR